MEFLEIVFYIFLTILAIYGDYLIAKVFEEIAIIKGFPEKSKMVFRLAFFGTLVGYLMVIALPDRGNQTNANENGNTQSPSIVITDNKLPKI